MAKLTGFTLFFLMHVPGVFIIFSVFAIFLISFASIFMMIFKVQEKFVKILSLVAKAVWSALLVSTVILLLMYGMLVERYSSINQIAKINWKKEEVSKLGEGEIVEEFYAKRPDQNILNQPAKEK